MATTSHNNVHPIIHLTLDFDTTLTVTDTLASLASIGYRHDHDVPRPPWSSIVSAYLADLNAHTTKYAHAPASRTTLAAEAAWLSSLANVEATSARRAVVEAGVWDGVTRTEIDAAAQAAVHNRDVRLREGWSQMVETVLQGRGKVEVCSVNWSRWWIYCCMKHAVATDEEGQQTNSREDLPNEIEVFANELPSIVSERVQEVELPLGQPQRLRTAVDKLCCFVGTRKGHIASLDALRAIPHSKLLSIYVGDSTSDLLCLVDADIGICMRDTPMGSGQRELEATCKRLNIELAPLEHFDWTIETTERSMRNESQNINAKRKLWWMASFLELNDWLLNTVLPYSD